MTRSRATLALLGLIGAAVLVVNAAVNDREVLSAGTDWVADLAAHWAPVIYQETWQDGRADFITGFDYDNDWIGDNNWNNLGDDGVNLAGVVYYWIVQSPNHWFIGYGIFHPRDWGHSPIGPLTLTCDAEFGASFLVKPTLCHENDMEGILLVVDRRGGGNGTLEGVIAVQHFEFAAYRPATRSLSN